VLRIRDVFPGSQISVPDSRTATKGRGEKKIVAIPFFVAINFTKFENYFIFEKLKKNIWANFLTKKLSLPGSGKNLFRIPDPDPGFSWGYRRFRIQSFKIPLKYWHYSLVLYIYIMGCTRR
jgi:hypothetical protein